MDETGSSPSMKNEDAIATTERKNKTVNASLIPIVIDKAREL